MEYSNGTAEAYRYHTPASYDTSAFVSQATAYCATSNVLPPVEDFHSASAARRFHPYLPAGDQSIVGPSAADNGHFRNGFSGPCDNQNGLVFEQQQADHVQTQHHFAPFADVYPPPSNIKTELNGGGGNETAEILDLDSHKVHVYQPPGTVMGLPPAPPHQHHHHSGGALAPTPPYTPATSVGSNSSSMGWMTPTPPLPSLAAPHPHEYRPNPFPTYDLPPMTVNTTNGNNTTPNSAPVAKSAPGWKPPANGQPTGGGGNHGGGSEARRPKTYNCEACNKWFTSSGHLKRHYNTTLHKNAIKASGGNSNGTAAAGEGRRSTTPSSRSTGTPTINSPAGSDEKTMDDMPVPRPSLNTSPKIIPSSPGNGDYRPPSQQAPPPLIHHQQLVQNGPPPLQSNISNYPPQQQQLNNSAMDAYRLPYSGPGNPSGSGMMTAGSSGPPPPGGHLPYYCPPPVSHSGYSSPYPQHAQQQQQQQQQQHVYPQSNTMSYPPNSIAPPPSSNANVQQLGVGPTASSRGIMQQHYHHEQPFMNNNNTIMEHNKIGSNGVEFNTIDADAFLIKSNDSDCSAGGSDDSPVGSEDADLDMSDAEEPERLSSANIAMPVMNKTNGGAVKSRAVVADNGGTATVGSFKCTQCDKAFNRVCYLTQHNNTFHKGDKPFKCHMCGKRFPNAELFDQHQQKHAGDKPYKCPLCPKQFNHKTDLRRHMCLHTGQKPFMCQVCNKGFIRKDHMVKHVQTHTRRNALHSHPPASAS
ncbi:Zinc finger 215-like protein [Daphnia magna]|uniref:Hydrogen peroxide stress regulator n=1 Tax=Daphnia magna TaxID=35525 RepID=A0A0P6J7L0_9CRUS|nr:Zinc finger 215-like protein [Daphnia magna]